MKYNFDDNNIVVGHIKELLHSFNLPMIPVYTDDTVLYKDRSYIKENKIVKWDGSEFIHLADYIYDWPMINLTKKLNMISAMYDSYTHEYLGDYLRFIRDYHHVDLMNMYNCFGKKMPSRIYYSLKFDDSFTLNIDTDNSNYNYYIVPIKFNKVYTIAIDSSIKWEMVSVLYSNIFIDNVPESLVKESYKVVSGSKFTNPFLYSTHFKCASECWQKEKSLVLLLKIPSEVKSSIVILEGNFTSSTNVIDGSQINTPVFDDEAKDTLINYNSKNSLLLANLGTSYPFSDRLVEYLLGNAITPNDQFMSNIGRVQGIVYEGSINGYYGIWDDMLTNSINEMANKLDPTKGGAVRIGNKIIKYDAGEDIDPPTEVVRLSRKFTDAYNDITGFVDKDVESLLRLH